MQDGLDCNADMLYIYTRIDRLRKWIGDIEKQISQFWSTSLHVSERKCYIYNDPGGNALESETSVWTNF